MSSTVEFDPTPIVGELAARDYREVPSCQQPRLREWIERLPSLTDRELARKAEEAIVAAAHANSLSMPYDESHVRASAAIHESGRRMLRDGHASEWCGPSIYDRAYGRALRSFGYRHDDNETCRCERGQSA